MVVDLLGALQELGVREGSEGLLEGLLALPRRPVGGDVGHDLHLELGLVEVADRVVPVLGVQEVVGGLRAGRGERVRPAGHEYDEAVIISFEIIVGRPYLAERLGVVLWP